jgi:signal peptidase II
MVNSPATLEKHLKYSATHTVTCTSMKRTRWKYDLTAWSIISIDQLSKLWVHFNMGIGAPGSVVLIGNWLKIQYVLNPGMAFGLQLGSTYGKLLLTICRILMAYAIMRHIRYLVRKKYPSTLSLWGWYLVLSGAVSNIIDSIFYGALLKNAPKNSPMAWFHGQVIDMIYLDLWRGTLPNWLPWIGGQQFAVFPICNVADIAILLGMVAIFLSFGQTKSSVEAQNKCAL